MTDLDRINTVLQAIKEGKEYTFLERLEQYGPMKDMATLRNFLLLSLVLIEESKVSESAATLMFKYIYIEKRGIGDLDERTYGSTVLNYLRDLALSPYVNLSIAIGRMLRTIIYDYSGQETAHIIRITPKEDLVWLNESLLEKYINANSIDGKALTLFYQCLQTINRETFQITLSVRACQLMYRKIMADGFNDYLSYFLRPYYTSMSSYWLPDAMYHVPEPFYGQIFAPPANFTQELSKRTPLHEKTLAGEILSFMTRFDAVKANGREVIDIRPLNLTKEWHKNARFVDENN